MKTELEKKLNKLPAYIDDIDGNRFMLSIIKCDFEKNPNNWQIDYMDIYKNTILASCRLGNETPEGHPPVISSIHETSAWQQQETSLPALTLLPQPAFPPARPPHIKDTLSLPFP